MFGCKQLLDRSFDNYEKMYKKWTVNLEMLGSYSLWPRYFPNKKADEKKKRLRFLFPEKKLVK